VVRVEDDLLELFAVTGGTLVTASSADRDQLAIVGEFRCTEVAAFDTPE
jgi:hypothetical protein